MTVYKCHICIKIIKLKNNNQYNPNKHILLCKSCLETTPTYTKKYCLKILEILELQNIKQIYNKNLFMESDIKPLIQKKNKENKQNKRRNELKQAFFDYKLDYNEFGLAYLYIYNGQNDIKTVLESELSKAENRSKRRMYLIKLFKENNLIYNDKMRSCYEYINDISVRGDREIIKMAEIENFLMESTTYLKLLDKYDYEDARDIALQEYMTKINSNNKYLDKATTVEFC